MRLVVIFSIYIGFFFKKKYILLFEQKKIFYLQASLYRGEYISNVPQILLSRRPMQI